MIFIFMSSLRLYHTSSDPEEKVQRRERRERDSS